MNEGRYCVLLEGWNKQNKGVPWCLLKISYHTDDCVIITKEEWAITCNSLYFDKVFINKLAIINAYC